MGLRVLQFIVIVDCIDYFPRGSYWNSPARQVGIKSIPHSNPHSWVINISRVGQGTVSGAENASDLYLLGLEMQNDTY